MFNFFEKIRNMLKKKTIKAAIPVVFLLFLILFAGILLKDKLNLAFFSQSACANSGSGCGAGPGYDGTVYDAGAGSCSYLISWQPDKIYYQKGENITFDYNIENVTWTEYCSAPDEVGYSNCFPILDSNCNLLGNWAKPYLSPAPNDDKYADWSKNYVTYCNPTCQSYPSSGGQMTRVLPDIYSDGASTAGWQKTHLHWKPAAWYNQTQGEEYDARSTQDNPIFINFPSVLSNLTPNTDNFCSNNTVNFTWNFFDPDGGSQNRFWILIDDESNFFTPYIVNEAPTTPSTSYTWTGGQTNKTYYWKVGAYDDEGTFSGFSYGSFSIPDSVCNRPPAANAGLDQTVDEGTAVALDGSLSSDPDNDPLTYSWTGALTLSNSSAVRPTSTAPQVDTKAVYAFTLKVSDGRGASSSDSVNITVRDIGDPLPPPKGENKPPSVSSASVDTFNNTFDLCVLANPSVIFSWVFSDQNAGDTQSAYRVQADNNNDFNSPEVDSEKVTEQDGTSNSYTIPSASPLAFNTNYYWRVMVWDSQNAASKWYPTSPKTLSFNTPKHDYPTIAFEPRKAVTGETVQFQDKSQVFGGTSKKSWNWDFGVGNNPENSTSSNPSVIFSSPGIKTITLRVTDSDNFFCSCDPKKQDCTVSVDLPLPGWIEIPPY